MKNAGSGDQEYAALIDWVKRGLNMANDFWLPHPELFAMRHYHESQLKVSAKGMDEEEKAIDWLSCWKFEDCNPISKFTSRMGVVDLDGAPNARSPMAQYE